PVSLDQVPATPPTGGWDALAAAGPDRWDVAVPGTVEEYAWDTLAAARRAAGERAADDPLAGDYVGVSWWWREFEVPAALLAPGDDGPRHLELQFDAVRLRAEVFVNQRLVGRDDVGNTPFTVDATPALHAGRNLLAVRVTDPGGNFDWMDHDAQSWGAATLPASHGFGGVTGPVRLVSTGPVRLADAWIVNTSDPRRIELHVDVENGGAAPATVAWTVHVRDAQGAPLKVDALRSGVACAPGRTHDALTLPFPDAALWSPGSPALHVARFELTTGPDVSAGGEGGGTSLGRVDDVVEQRFGFRSFTIDDTGGSATLRLNGERIVLRSAISWGFWPVSGLVPSPELARRQVEDARALGLNMLNHHRTLAAPGLLDVQDELGLLAYEEPGGYACAGGDDVCRALAREKLLRMVRRDRSHPSLVIVNLINEAADPPTEAQQQDLLDAHALDPDLVMTFTSGMNFASGGGKDGDDAPKLHVRPGEATPRTNGWTDDHNAPGPGVWRDSFWNGPADYRRSTSDAGEVVFWGEEGAIASPPRLAEIMREIGLRTAAGLPDGWDGELYRAWAGGWERFLDEKGLRTWFPTLDSVTVPLADIAVDYQARSIEQVRLGDVTDGYVINGWEDEPLENHSGIVDLWRHVKGDAARLAEANAPTRLVVKLRSSVLSAGEFITPSTQTASQTLADVYLVDETARTGPHVLSLALRDAAGQALWSREVPCTLHGGDVFGEPLATELQVAAEVQEGPHVLAAELRRPPGPDGKPGELVARAEEPVWVVDWRSQALPVKGAVLESGHALRAFFKHTGRPEPEVFHEDMEPVDFVLVGDFDPEPREVVPAEALGSTQVTDKHGEDINPSLDTLEFRPGLRASYFRGEGFESSELVLDRSPEVGPIDFEWSREPPAAGLERTNYSARWTGELLAPESGRYAFHTLSDDGLRLWVGHAGAAAAPLIDDWSEHEPTWDRGEIELEAGKAYPLRLEYHQSEGGAQIRLCWTRPSQQQRTRDLVAELLRRANDGATLCFLDRADRWAGALAAAGAVQYAGRLDHGKYWLGGGFLAREHHLFSGLPTGALGGPWQELVHYGANRFGLRLSGEECLCFCVSDHQHEPATAVGVVPCGKGRILLSTLDVVRSLNVGWDAASNTYAQGPADATRRYLVNVLQWAGAR
ncbi:MAG TPA: PA14 domain-containing protein, partial [Planctomycetota bacterium]|nr:PA14 domain-containing protein [Planctomycetota bacterium]